MPRIERIPYESLPLSPEKIRPFVKSQFFSPAARDAFVADFQELAKRRQRDVFLASQDDGSESTFGLTEAHRVTVLGDRRVQLSGSHARHKLAPGVPDLPLDEVFDLYIDPSSNVILKAEPTAKPPKTIGSLIQYDPIDIESDIVPVSATEAERFFSILRRQPHIPFQYPANGCWARAQEMSRIIERHLDGNRGDVVLKVWHYGDLVVQTENNPECTVEWGFHVAPAVMVEGDLMLLDPSLFDHPVPFDTWRLRQLREPSQTTRYALTSRQIYNRLLSGDLFVETQREAEASLEEFRTLLFKQIYERGPIPYLCMQP